MYVVGRGEAKLSKIIGELERINPQGSYTSIKSEISLLKNVDAACEDLKGKEKGLDLLVMCPGYLKLSRVGMYFPGNFNCTNETWKSKGLERSDSEPCRQRRRTGRYNLAPLLRPHALHPKPPAAAHV